MLLNETNEAVESLLEVLRSQGERDYVESVSTSMEECIDGFDVLQENLAGVDKRRELGSHVLVHAED